MSILTDLGIAVCTLTYGKDSSFAGVNAATTITITPKGANNAKLALVWDATGDSFQSFEDKASADPGVVGTIDVPQTGQDGFLMNGQPFKDWYYEANVRSSIAGQNDIVRTYRFQIPAGTTSLDVDRLPLQGQVILPPVVAPTVPVTSLNGLTGPVTLDASDIDAIPSDLKGAPGGVAELTSGGLVKESQLPSRLSAANIEQIDEAASEALDTITDGRLSAPSLAATIATLKQWARNPDMLIAGTVTRDSNGAATSAPVTWPDGSPGTYTADTVSTTFPGAVDAYHITYGSPVTKTFTQPAVTRNAAGAPTNVPQIVVS
ncbi:hypothetical protein ACFJGV_15220 [Cnuibacter sp. UC19_7]|uniref:hypothetical protein n=1 Tax=Cnuibacter sp. UC19_7 TaxID=3350166 RepID=UPI00366EE1B8